jgi:hypothetical protein
MVNLARSGIGKKEVLEKLGITQKVELPVGENFQGEHVLFFSCLLLTCD